MDIPFHKTHITEKELHSVTEAIKSGWLTMGPKTIEFEKKFSSYLFNNNEDKCLSCNSATAALHLALKAIGLKENDEVIIPTNTFIATAEVVTYFNAIPILCDIEYDTHNIDVSKINALITDKTKAIIPVHFGGQPCDMNEIMDIAKKHNLKIIEDAAHALPASYNNQPIGTIGDITCFSFYATKTLACGEGGMAASNNVEYIKNMKINRLHGINNDAWDRYTKKGSWVYDIVDNGFKYNMTDINAALGLTQLKKLEWMCRRREDIAQAYDKAFQESNITCPTIKPDRTTSRHLYVIKVDNRDELHLKLKEAGINTSVHFIPVHHMTFYKEKFKYNDTHYPVAEEVFSKSLSLPIYPDLSHEQVAYITKKVLEYTK
ncbi:MAG: UDP-4-amino-4,6-dideoxy-N-acetyl-beta-L-altrosamine transaminase [Denitrovibrio sp.]|nr:MAG: UDP-4-amino-4,6-dideoxy-N-acetyl-beta-L-altrosamine transaminase [Denitrovibrio sp.]